jgi:ParB family chromosome partitioning protein
MRCKDLVDSIKAQGGQEFPAVVRCISGDPSYDYEVICGARRHWAVTWLRAHHYDHRFLIEIRDLNDEEAFRLSDIENRDREDISDYERATDYAKALSRFYKTQEEMAERLEVTTTWLSRYLALAELPDEVVQAYADVIHIKVDHASQLMPLIRRDRQIRAKVLARAAQLAAEQADARASGKTGPDGRAVFRELRAAAVRRTAGSKGVLQLYKTKITMRPMLEVKRQGRSGLVMRIIPGSGADRAELVEACEKALNDYLWSLIADPQYCI